MKNKLINMQDYQSKKDNETKNFTFLEMVSNPKKRKEVFDAYDKDYVETDDEKEIFESMKKRRSKL